MLVVAVQTAPCMAQGPAPSRGRVARARTSMAADAGLFALGGASALGSGVALFPSPSPFHASQPGWRGGILFDDSARSALRLGTPEALDVAATVSDVLLVATMFGAIAIESTIAPLAQDD